MATPNSPSRASTQKRRAWPWIVVAAVVLLALAWWYARDNFSGDAEAGTAYAARVACSCRQVAGRSLEDCEKDLIAGMEMVSLSEDEETRSVTASVPLMASATARYKQGYGCVLDPWED